MRGRLEELESEKTFPALNTGLVVKLLKILMHSRVGGALLTAELAVAVGWINDLPGVTVDPGWKHDAAGLYYYYYYL